MGQPNLDFRKIRDRTADIRSSVAELRELISQPPEAFSADRRNVYATAHLFLVAIEAVASICNHILSRLAHRAPTSYSECFESLGDLGMIPKDLAKPTTSHLPQRGKKCNMVLRPGIKSPGCFNKTPAEAGSVQEKATGILA